MTGRRWRSLDANLPADDPSAGRDEDASISDASLEAAAPGPDPQALKLYQLGRFDACADLLTGRRLTSEIRAPDLRLAGMALGRAGRTAQAAEVLQIYNQARPADSHARAALVTALIGIGEEPGDWETPPAGALSEIAGAGDWESGRRSLARNEMPAASAFFHRAAMRLLRHSPSPVLGERAPLLYLGVSWVSLLQGQVEAAVMSQRPFLPYLQQAAVLTRLIASTAEVAAGLRECNRSEMADATAPLHEALLAARLHIQFWDGVGPVIMRWEGPLV